MSLSIFPRRHNFDNARFLLRREGNTSDKNFSCKSARRIRLNGRVSGMQERTRDDTRERGSPDVRERERRRDKGRRDKKGKCERNENRGQKQDMIREQKDIPLLVYSSSFFSSLILTSTSDFYFRLLLFYSFHLCSFLCFSCSAFICIREDEAHFADQKLRSSLRRSINYTEEIIRS